MSNFFQIEFYLLFDQQTYILCIMFYRKNLIFKHVIDFIAINL